MYVVLLIKVLFVGKQTVLKKASPLTCIVACPVPVSDPAPDPVVDPVPDPVPDPVLDPVPIGETFIPRKKIVVEGNTLKYFVKDKVAVCSLPSQFSTIKDLTEIIQKFNDAGLCEGCISPELVNIRTSSGWKAEGIVRSKTCTFICDKRVFYQCTLMIKNLKRKAMRSNRTCVFQKLKRSQQVTKNAVRKLERRQSTIEVTFMIVLFENEASTNSIYKL